MTRNDCAIVRDLLPLYTEKMVSPETGEFIEEHLSRCEGCAAEARAAAAPEPTPEAGEPPALPLEALRRRLRKKRLLSLLLGVLLGLCCLICVFSALDTPEFFPYSEDLLSLSTQADGSLLVSFRPDVTGMELSEVAEPDGGGRSFFIQAWTSSWERAFRGGGSLSTRIEALPGDRVFYSRNNGQPDVCLYGGEGISGGSVSLPTLRLGYYLILMGLALAALLVLRLIIRKSRWKSIPEIAALYPAAYLLAQLLLGIDTVSYCFTRDFFLLLSTSVPLFFALLLARSLLRCFGGGKGKK